jgi:hypothetical protein
MIPSKVTPSLYLAACYFTVNWAGDQNNYKAAVMVTMTATVVMGMANKLAAATMAM